MTDVATFPLAGGGAALDVPAVGVSFRAGLRQAPQVTVSAEDPADVVVDSDVLTADPVTVDWDGRSWRLRGIGRRRGHELTLTLWDAAAAALDAPPDGDRSVQGGLDEFAGRLAADAGVDLTVGGKPPSEAKTFERRADETSWAALGQAVDDRDGWERFVVNGRLLLATRDWLATDPVELDERDAAVDPIGFDLPPGGTVDECTVTVTVAGDQIDGRWTPGAAVRLPRPRPVAGVWLVDTVRRRSLTSPTVDLTLTRP